MRREPNDHLVAWGANDKRLTELRSAAIYLLRQLAIVELRITLSWRVCIPTSDGLRRPELLFSAITCLQLDVETYYTVAADALKVIGQMIPSESGQRRFHQERTYNSPGAHVQDDHDPPQSCHSTRIR